MEKPIQRYNREKRIYESKKYRIDTVKNIGKILVMSAILTVIFLPLDNRNVISSVYLITGLAFGLLINAKLAHMSLSKPLWLEPNWNKLELVCHTINDSDMSHLEIQESLESFGTDYETVMYELHKLFSNVQFTIYETTRRVVICHKTNVSTLNVIIHKP